MDVVGASKTGVQRPWHQLRKGVTYTRHSIVFEVWHPIVLALTLLELVLALGVGAGIFAAVFRVNPVGTESSFVVVTVAAYFLLAIPTILVNATIAGYVLAAELGVPDPLSRAVGQVRSRLAGLVGYAIVWASVLSAIVVLDWFATAGAFAWPVSVALQALTRGGAFAWGVGTVFVVPILVFEHTTTLRSAIYRSAGLLRESALCFVIFWPIALCVLVLFVLGGIAVLITATGPLTLVGPVLTVFVGFIVFNALSAVFNSLLYGDVAGPLNAVDA